MAALSNTVKTTVLRTDMELVLRGHKGRKYCWSAKTDTESCFFGAVPDNLAPDVYLSSTGTAAELQYGIDLFGLFLPEL